MKIFQFFTKKNFFILRKAYNDMLNQKKIPNKYLNIRYPNIIKQSHMYSNSDSNFLTEALKNSNVYKV